MVGFLSEVDSSSVVYKGAAGVLFPRHKWTVVRRRSQGRFGIRRKKEEVAESKGEVRAQDGSVGATTHGGTSGEGEGAEGEALGGGGVWWLRLEGFGED